jgi:polyphosphate kinase
MRFNMSKYRLFNREISWLAFNHRVLQEAKDTTVPLHERIKFMAIFSSNLDEFFRVRVAALRNLIVLKQKSRKKLTFDPGKLIKKIHTIVFRQQEELGAIHRDLIQNELVKHHIHLVQDSDLSRKQGIFLKQYFRRELLALIQPVFLAEHKQNLFLEDRALYLIVQLYPVTGNTDSRFQFALIKIPSPPLNRFITIPSGNNRRYIIFIDDIIRLCLSDIFPGYAIRDAYAIKLSRDAEIYIEDEFSDDLVEKIKKGLKKRKTGVPCRLLYDMRMPAGLLTVVRKRFDLNKDNLIAGGRYHNYNDFFSFPNLGPGTLEYPGFKAIKIHTIESAASLYSAIDKRDVLLYYPYHSFAYFLKFLKQAVEHPLTTSIKITLYRTSDDSKVIQNLIKAARKGIEVSVFVEVMARFDEASNIKWAEKLRLAGAAVTYSFPDLKVHAKTCLVTRQEKNTPKNYLYLSSGNFNEKTAQQYTDVGFFTCDKRLTAEVEMVFAFLINKQKPKHFNHLLVAPFCMRRKFYRLIAHEIKMARQGKKAEIFLKLNNIQDPKIINKLYAASNAGVKIKMVVRGICCLVPGIKNMSENIEVISIIDRFLEHSRMYIFHNNGKPKFFLASADWMTRNLSRRIELVVPIYDRRIQKDLLEISALIWKDSAKARIIDKKLKNVYRTSGENRKIRSQTAIYDYLASK